MPTRIALATLVVSYFGVCMADKFSVIARDQKGFTFDQKVEILKTHNMYRRSAGASNMNHLFWHSGLEKLAQAWAENCDYNHNRDRHRRENLPYTYVGENLYLTTAWKSNTRYMDSWFNENKNFFANNTCMPGKMCGHYAQMMWYNTETVACGVRYCEPVTGSSIITKGFLVVCDYGPLGNTPGEPILKKGEPCTECPAGYECKNQLCAVPNCNGVVCQNGGKRNEEVCLCDCRGTGYEGEFCEKALSPGGGNGSGSGSGNGQNVRDNVTSPNLDNGGRGLKEDLACRNCVYFVGCVLLVILLYI